MSIEGRWFLTFFVFWISSLIFGVLTGKIPGPEDRGGATMSERKTIRVLLMRRDQQSLTFEELRVLEESFPDCDLNFQRSDARDYLEHEKICEEFKPDLVLLPREKPIPSTAMQKGFRHVTFTPDGKLLELKAINPVLVPFQP